MEPGFSGTTKLAYASDEALDPVRDLATDSAKDEFTARVLEPQGLATQLIPPHFHVRGEADFDLNVQLARMTVRVQRSVGQALSTLATRASATDMSGPLTPGLDLGNTPALLVGSYVRRRVLIQRASSDTQGLVAATCVCAGTTARAVAVCAPDEIDVRAHRG